MPAGDTEALLRSIRRHTHIPGAHPDYGDADTLLDATEELHSYLLPLGMGERQELWAGPTGMVPLVLEDGVAVYALPGRAVGGKARTVLLTDSRGNPVHLETWGPDEMRRQPPQTGIPCAFAWEGGSFRLYPTPRNTGGYTLAVQIYVRPGELVLPEECATLTQVETDGTSTTVRAVQTADNGAVFTVGAVVDVVSSAPPFDVAALDATVVSVDLVSGSTYEVVLDSTTPLSVGAYLCPAQQSPVVQAPLEWHPLLALKVATRQLASLGDMESAAAKSQEGGQKAKQAATLVRPRREDVGRKPRNGMDRFGGNGWGY